MYLHSIIAQLVILPVAVPRAFKDSTTWDLPARQANRYEECFLWAMKTAFSTRSIWGSVRDTDIDMDVDIRTDI